MAQTMFLLQAPSVDSMDDPRAPLVFQVLGATGREYSVMLHLNKATCECIDFCKHRRMCKHVLFMVHRVAGVRDVFDADSYMARREEIRTKVLSAIAHRDSRAVPVAHTSADRSVPRNEECYICYESMQGGEPACSQCNNGFHRGCVDAWLKRKHTCPMCRAIFVQIGDFRSAIGTNMEGPLDRFRG